MLTSGAAPSIETVHGDGNGNGALDSDLPLALAAAGVAAQGLAKNVTSGRPYLALSNSWNRFQPPRARLVTRPPGVAGQVEPSARDTPNIPCDCDEEVLQYAKLKDLTGYLVKFVEIAAQCFHLVNTPSCRLVQDPELDHQYIVLALKVKDDGAVLDSEDRFEQTVIQTMPSADLFLLTHTFDIE
jgi:hypothetical protein